MVLNNEDEMTGFDYKKDVVNSICLLQWSPEIVTPLTAMFTDIPLSKEEHTQVVNKLGQYIDKLTPHEIPPLVFQLLKLCKEWNSRCIFIKLQHYFGLRIYENKSFAFDSESESTNVDSIDDANEHDVLEAESIVLFHIHNAATFSHNSIKEYFASLKNTLRSPEFVLHPFQLALLFTLSTESSLEEKVFDIIKSCISRAYHEEQKCKNSCWFRELIPATCNIEAVFQQVINISVQDRYMVVEGLVNFAFVLLGTGSALFRDPIAEKQWTLGTMILLKIIKRKRDIASTITQKLCERITTGQNVLQYIECIYMLSRSYTLLMLECQSVNIELVEALVQIPGPMADFLLDALMPLVKVSPTIRDHLILLLRKALNLSIIEINQMAVYGFVKLLTNLKISNTAALSQSNSIGSFHSGRSFFTQLSINRSVQCTQNPISNEDLCLELLGILEQCFVQQADVKNQLYEGVFDAVILKPELAIPVLRTFWLHFAAYCVMDEDKLPPLKFGIITHTKHVDVVLQEPIGKLIFTIGLLVSQSFEIDPENSIVMKLIDILESVCDRMINCELIHFELDDGTDLLDTLPESQHKVHVLKEAILVYEALIGYKIFLWRSDSKNHAQQINGLYLAYHRLLHFSKNLSKPKKGESKKKDADGNRTTQSNSKLSAQKSIRTFKAPETILNFPVVIKTLTLLHESEVNWASAQDANMLKPKKEIHQHIMQCAIYLVNNVKHKRNVDSESSKLTYGYLVEMADLIYNRCIKRLKEFMDFDCETALLALDCFHSILTNISGQFKANFASFLKKLESDENDFLINLSAVIEVYQKLFESDEEDVDVAEFKKIQSMALNTLLVLSNQIPAKSSDLSIKFYDWLKNFAINHTLTSRQTVTLFMDLLCDTHIKYKVSLTLLENLAQATADVLGVISEEDSRCERIKIVNELSAHNILLSLCRCVKNILEDADWLISRIRAEFNMISYPGDEKIERRREYLKSKERGITCQLCFVLSIITKLSNIALQPGNMSESVLKNIAHLYTTLTNLTRYFLIRSSKINPVFQGARFESLVKVGGKNLSNVVYRLILYIEESQKEAANTQSKKKPVNSTSLKSKVLKETRLIPKVVYEMEQFSKTVIQLSNKTKIDLARHVGQGTVRDFRILHLKEVLEQAGDVNDTLNESNASEHNSTMQRESQVQSEDLVDSTPPPTKKSRST